METGKFVKEDVTLLYSGNENQHVNGVGVILKNTIAKSLIGYWPISERAMLLKLEGKPFNISIIQVYAPTNDHPDDEIEKFYDDIQKAIKYVKSDEVLVVMGDWNAKVGEGITPGITGQYGLGDRNDRGDRLIQFCQENQLIVTNTTFKQPPRRLYTWKSPGDVARNQIDYILIRNRFRNAVKDTRTYPGADVHSDHVPVVCRIKIKLKILKKPKQNTAKDLNALKEEEIRNKFSIAVNNRYQELYLEGQEQTDNEMIESQWNALKTSIIESSEKHLPKAKKEIKQDWMNETILNKMKQRKKAKEDPIAYKLLDNEIKRDCEIAKEAWLNKKCEEVEQLEKEHKPREQHKKVKELTNRKSRPPSSAIKDKAGEILFEPEDIQKRWMEYMEELFDDERGEMPDIEDMDGPDILKEEVEAALRSMNDGKAPGGDSISAEMLKALDDLGLERLTDLTNKIYNTGYIPEDMKESVFIPIPKKPKATQCTEYRTISLMSHATKVLLKIILERE